ncbi:MAG: hypothetical protein ABFD07_17935 [Methanobacterium sp.]
MKFKYILVFSILLTVFVAGCVEESKADSGRFTTVSEEQLGNGNWVRVIHDNDLNVTIYQAASTYGYQSISAIPDWQLRPPSNYMKV